MASSSPVRGSIADLAPLGVGSEVWRFVGGLIPAADGPDGAAAATTDASPEQGCSSKDSALPYARLNVFTMQIKTKSIYFLHAIYR